MKIEDYINTLIKERDELKNLCKSHVEKIILFQQDLIKKDKKIQKLESEIKSPNEKTQKEPNDDIKIELNNLKAEYKDLQNKYNILFEENEYLKQNLNNDNVKTQKSSNKSSNKIKSELNNLKAEYKDLQNKYNILLAENEEYRRIFYDVENECDSN
jgi:chromosome segregation ATPase